MPNKRIPKKPIPDKPKVPKPARKNVVRQKPASDIVKGLGVLKETLRASPVHTPASDKVENLAIACLGELKEADVTFRKGTQASSRNIATNIRNSPATYERSFLEIAA